MAERLRSIRQAVRRWWRGEWKAHDVPGVIGVYHEQHWTARVCHSVVDYVWQHHWQFISAVIAVAGIIAAIKSRG
jgi:hypothetical protein